MGDGQAQRIGSIRTGQAGQAQQALHHLLHLALGSTAVADHSLLHLQRRVLGHRQIAGHQRRQAGATGLAQQQRGLRVDVDEHDLHRRRLGLVAGDDFVYAFKQQLEPRRQVATVQLGRAYGAAGDVGQRLTLGVDHAEARGLQAGVYAQNSHVLIY